jgi:hypothetical protein
MKVNDYSEGSLFILEKLLAVCLRLLAIRYLFYSPKIEIMKLTFLSCIAAMALLVSCETSRTATTSTTPTTTTSTADNAAFGAPTGMQTTFSTQYPNASAVTWSRYDAAATPIDWELTDWPALTTNDYVVTFNMGNDRYYAWYTANGQWVGTAHAVTDHNTLPEGVRNVLNTQFTGYKIDKIERELWKDRLAYEIKLKRGDDDKVKLLIDSNGTILKQKLKD